MFVHPGSREPYNWDMDVLLIMAIGKKPELRKKLARLYLDAFNAGYADEDFSKIRERDDTREIAEHLRERFKLKNLLEEIRVTAKKRKVTISEEEWKEIRAKYYGIYDSAFKGRRAEELLFKVLEEVHSDGVSSVYDPYSTAEEVQITRDYIKEKFIFQGDDKNEI